MERANEIDTGLMPMCMFSNLGERLLHDCFHGYGEQTRLILQTHPEMVDYIGEDGHSPLLVACAQGKLECVKLILEIKGDISKEYCGKGKGKRFTLMHMACSLASHEQAYTCVSLLAKYRHDVKECLDMRMWSPLHYAAFYQHEKVVECLIDKGCNVNQRNNRGFTPLHIASFRGCYEMIDYFIANDADVNAVTEEGLTPLHLASWEGHADVVRSLLANSADTNCVELIRHYTALHLACIKGHSEVTSILLEYGADIEAIDKNGRRPLHLACKGSYVRSCELLLNEGANKNAKDIWAYTAKHLAIMTDSIECCYLLDRYDNDTDCEIQSMNDVRVAACRGTSRILQYLLEQNSSLLDSIDHAGNTLMHFAAFSGNLSCIILLESNGLSIYKSNTIGVQPIHKACWQAHPDIVKYLAKDHDGFEIIDKLGRRPLHVACYGNNAHVMDYLLKQEVNVSVLDRHGRSPLHYAVITCSLPFIAKILKKTLENVNQADDLGHHPLHVAIMYSNVKILGGLLSVGSSPTLVDKFQRNCLHLAAWNGLDIELFARIRSVCNISILFSSDSRGRMPLHYAVMKSRRDLSQYLLTEQRTMATLPFHGVTDILGRTLFHYSLLSGDVKLIEIMKPKDKLDIFASDSNGWNLVHFSVFSGILKVCLDHNILQFSDIGVLVTKDKNGHSPLHISSINNNRDMLLCMLRTLDTNQIFNAWTDRIGNTPLHYASAFGSADVIDLAMQRLGMHIDPNGQNLAGKTPLHIAAYYGEKECILVLLDCGALAHFRDSKGRTALHYVCLKGYSECVDILLQNDDEESICCVFDVDYEGRTALHMAVLSKSTECCVEILLGCDGDPKVLIGIEDSFNRSALDYAKKLECSEIIVLLQDADGIEDRLNQLHRPSFETLNDDQDEFEFIIFGSDGNGLADDRDLTSIDYIERDYNDLGFPEIDFISSSIGKLTINSYTKSPRE